MNSREAREIAARITAGLHFPGGSGRDWSSVSADPDDLQWSLELLSRITIMVGAEPIEYVSGYVEGGKIHGDIVVLTRSAIVRATFTVSREYIRPTSVLDATVTATRRSSISSVSVTSVSPFGADDEEWPRQVSAIVSTDDGKTFRLPLIKRTTTFEENDTATLISSLLRD
jgi:hypothetical protein